MKIDIEDDSDHNHILGQPAVEGMSKQWTASGDHRLSSPAGLNRRQELDPIVAFGYLLLTVDMSMKKPKLTISFRSNAQDVTHDNITLKLT